MIISYQLLLILLAPVFCWLTLKHYLNHKDSNYLWQRLGLKLPQTDKPVWFHCASVGEVITAIPLINLYKEKFPDHNILVTTNTVTGARICRDRLSFVQHCFLPLDYRSFNRRFLNKINPQELINLETEIWPNLFDLCHQQNILVTIINGRLSDRTLNTNSWSKTLYRKTLAHVDKIYCRSEKDATGYQQLGASKQQTQVLGNLKFAAIPENKLATQNLITRPYVLVASSHSGEEKKIIESWKKSDHNNLLLVIAPRHPERRDEIIKDINPLCNEIKVRSQQQDIDATTDVYLADTLGEMAALFQYAEFVIMGGSFVNKGGHNILEPAIYSKAIIYGESMHNFAAENDLFLENNAAVQVSNEEEAISCLNKLLADKDYRQQLGNNAKTLMLKYSSIAETYLDKLTSGEIQ